MQDTKLRYNLQVVDVKRQIKSPILKRNFYIINVRKHDNFREILMNLICFSPITSANENYFNIGEIFQTMGSQDKN